MDGAPVLVAGAFLRPVIELVGSGKMPDKLIVHIALSLPQTLRRCVLVAAAALGLGVPVYGIEVYVQNTTGSTVYVQLVDSGGADFSPAPLTLGPSASDSFTMGGGWPTNGVRKVWFWADSGMTSYLGDSQSAGLGYPFGTPANDIGFTWNGSTVVLDDPWTGPAAPPEIAQLMSVVSAVLLLGVTCGALIFCTRFLWRLFQQVVGVATWSE